ncbi:MAG: pseudouridine synthase [Paracoccaceae bacterium]
MTDYRPPEFPLGVLRVDEDLVFVDKPSGLLSVSGKPAEHWDCVEHRVRLAFPDALLIHRLDLETSGVMVFARTAAAQRHVNLQFEKRYVQKTYIARVAGEVVDDAGEIDLPLTSDWPRRPMQKVCHETGRQALTRWRVLQREGSVTRLELRPETARPHQSRVHLKEHAHPILGDPFYAPEDIYQAAPRLQLHALRLALRHPSGGEALDVSAPCPF